jgi:hypothetical protein
LQRVHITLCTPQLLCQLRPVSCATAMHSAAGATASNLSPQVANFRLEILGPAICILRVPDVLGNISCDLSAMLLLCTQPCRRQRWQPEPAGRRPRPPCPGPGALRPARVTRARWACGVFMVLIASCKW